MKNLKLAAIMAIIMVLGQGQLLNLAGQSTPSSAGFEKLKALAGAWEGTSNADGKEIPVNTSFRVVSDGSALISDLMRGTPHEMVTVFHMNGSELMATHYCAAHNQPRFRMVPSSDPKVIAFAFKDATNLVSPSAPHMVRVKFTIVDANHHIEDWTFLANGQKSTRRFEFHRKL